MNAMMKRTDRASQPAFCHLYLQLDCTLRDTAAKQGITCVKDGFLFIWYIYRTSEQYQCCGWQAVVPDKRTKCYCCDIDRFRSINTLHASGVPNLQRYSRLTLVTNPPGVLTCTPEPWRCVCLRLWVYLCVHAFVCVCMSTRAMSIYGGSLWVHLWLAVADQSVGRGADGRALRDRSDPHRPLALPAGGEDVAA